MDMDNLLWIKYILSYILMFWEWQRHKLKILEGRNVELMFPLHEGPCGTNCLCLLAHFY